MSRKKLFSLLSILSFLILFGIIANVPSAQAACTKDPTWLNLGHSDGPRYVTYHLRLINNCSGTNTFRIRVSALPTSPRALTADWKVEQDDGTWGPLNTMVTRQISGGENIDVRVIRDVNTYHPDATYRFVEVRAALNSNTSVNSTLANTLVYIVVNRPDLVISAFNYPGGPTCEQTNPNIRIKNEGWVAATNDFNVTVDNGFAASRTWTVTQRVDHGDVINLSSRFTGMGLPPVGTYTAKAIVDTTDKVFEEVEGNNEATDKYTTTSCITPTPTTPPASSFNPIGYHDSSSCEVSTGWTCDPDNYSQALAVHFYEGSTFLGSTTANQSRPDVAAAGRCGGNGNVGFSFATPESLKDGNSHTITAYAINIGTGTGNPKLTNTPKTFSCSPPYSISGGLFSDLNENGIKDSGENYIGGTFNISGVGNVTSGSTGFTTDVVTGTYTVSSNLPDGYEFTYPVIYVPPPPPPSVNVTVGTSCSKGTHEYASCDVSGNVINVNFGVRVKPADPWLSGDGGDMRVDNGLDNEMPDGFYFSNIFDSPEMDHGIVFGTGLDLGGPPAAKANTNNWFIGNMKYNFDQIRTEYSEMYSILDKGGALKDSRSIFAEACSTNTAPYCALDPNLLNGVYVQTAPNVVIRSSSDYTFQKGYNYIFLIDGDLRIENNIIVPIGSTAMFIVNGNITIDREVTRIDGIYSAGGDFEVEGSREDYQGIDDPLIIRGSVIANASRKTGASAGTFINNRDLDRGNDINPSVSIISRPDFVLNAPALIRSKSYTIREVAPGSKPF